MAYIQINSVPSYSTDWQNGKQLSKSSSYVVYVGGLSTNTLDVYVYFLTGTGVWDYDQSYNNVSITTTSYWTAKGWMGPYTYEKVEYGTACVGDSGPDSYGYISDYQATFTNVPASTVAIGVEYYDGSSWSDTEYWALYTPITMSWSNRDLTISQSGNAVNVSWQPATVSNGATDITYYLFSESEDNVLYSGNATSASVTPLKFGEELVYYVLASHSSAENSVWSNTVYFTAEEASHYLIRCYLNELWQDCLVLYYDGTDWIECVPNYYDGSSWKTCSF